MQDFFISYNKADETWAKGIGDWLDQAGYTTVFQQQDFVPATNFAAEMHRALQNMKRMIMVLSPDYLTAKFPLAEWTAAFATDPTCEKGTLIPVRVRECKPDGLLRPIVYIDLVGLNATDGRKAFLDGITSVLNGKRPLESSQPVPIKKKPKGNRLSQKNAGNQNTNVLAERIDNLTIKMAGKKLPSIQPPDVVGANVEMRAYTEYLIDRYIDWRQDGVNRGIDRRRFHPSMIHRDIKRDFGARTFLVPQTRFRDLIHYLHVRINDTIKGRNNKHRNYHSFEEHLDILHGNKSNPAPGAAMKEDCLAGAVVNMFQAGLTGAQARAQTISCSNNLKQLGIWCRLWANEHGDKFPTSLSALKNESGFEKVQWCRQNRNVPYELLSPGVSETDPSIAYAWCPVHKNVMLSDGSVQDLVDGRRLERREGKWRIVSGKR